MPLRRVKAHELVVELYGPEERVEASTVKDPYELHFCPKLGYDDWGPRTRPINDKSTDFWGCHRAEWMFGLDRKDICVDECRCDIVR